MQDTYSMYPSSIQIIYKFMLFVSRYIANKNTWPPPFPLRCFTTPQKSCRPFFTAARVCVCSHTNTRAQFVYKIKTKSKEQKAKSNAICLHTCKQIFFLLAAYYINQCKKNLKKYSTFNIYICLITKGFCNQ